MDGLPNAVAMWPTPRAGKVTDEDEDSWTARRDKGHVSTPPLTLAVKMWRTPNATEGDGGAQHGEKRLAGGHMMRLRDQVKMYPTPDVGAAKGRGAASAEDRTRLCGSLNPTWVEWLQGYPLGWTDCADSETPSSRKSRRKS